MKKRSETLERVKIKMAKNGKNYVRMEGNESDPFIYEKKMS